MLFETTKISSILSWIKKNGSVAVLLEQRGYSVKIGQKKVPETQGLLLTNN